MLAIFNMALWVGDFLNIGEFNSNSLSYPDSTCLFLSVIHYFSFFTGGFLPFFFSIHDNDWYLIFENILKYLSNCIFSIFQNNIFLNKKMLSTLAAYEPRTFQVNILGEERNRKILFIMIVHYSMCILMTPPLELPNLQGMEFL